MKEHSKYKYITQPNQGLFCFKYHVYYNVYSMRSQKLNPHSTKILGFGDSILNGGAHTDQDTNATSILSQELSGEKIEVKNGKYNEQEQKIIDFCKNNNVNLIAAIDYLTLCDYREGIHPIELWQKKMVILICKESLNIQLQNRKKI